MRRRSLERESLASRAGGVPSSSFSWLGWLGWLAPVCYDPLLDMRDTGRKGGRGRRDESPRDGDVTGLIKHPPGIATAL